MKVCVNVILKYSVSKSGNIYFHASVPGSVMGVRSPYSPREFFKGVIDEAKVGEDRTAIIFDGNGGKYMHGKRSWRIEGHFNQEVTISQLLNWEVVEYVRDRKQNQDRGVCFSFWYKLASVV